MPGLAPASLGMIQNAEVRCAISARKICPGPQFTKRPAVPEAPPGKNNRLTKKFSFPMRWERENYSTLKTQAFMAHGANARK
jgi:hypothetical protein